MALAPGTRFGSYEVVEQIGAGGMGEVFRATDTSLKRDVALKVLPQTFIDDADRLARFQREAEILASLNHPNIATIHGLENADGQTVIVMELVDGPTLADRIAQGPIPPNEAMGIALQIIAALEAAHDRGIVHRDLKPANVKVRDDGTVKVLDFGISKPIDPAAISGGAPVTTTPAMTQTGVILGTAAYMSPEQARGRFVDQRTDIWAFGCLLFEMLTGQPAFGGEDVMGILARVIDRDTDLTSIPGTVSLAARNAIKLCLAKDPAKRIADVRDVRLALDGAFETRAPVAATQARRRSAMLPLALVAITAVVTAAVMAVVRDAPDGRPPAVTRSSFLLPDDPVQPTIPAIGLSRDGRQIAIATRGGIYRRDLDALEARLIPGTEDESPVVPVFSPDGQAIVYRANSGNQVKRIGVEGGTPLPLMAGTDANGGWRWDIDDVITFGDEETIGQISPTTGESVELFTEAGFNHIEPTWLPGGRRLLVERRDQDTNFAEIVVYEVDTREATVLFPGKQPTYTEPGYLVYIDTTLGLMATTFDPETLAVGPRAPLVEDVLHLSLGGGAQYRLSPSGTLIYISGSVDAAQGGRALVFANAADGIVETLDLPPDDYVGPSVSPDGSQLAVQAGSDNDQIFVYDLAGNSERRQLTFEGNNRRPRWSPDGTWIAFESDRDGQSRIYRRRANGRGVAEPLTGPADGRAHFIPAFTPDGSQLAYVEADQNDNQSADIWIVALPDGEPQPLVSGEGSQVGIVFSPNGDAMAYFRVVGGTYDIFVEPFPPDGSRTRVTDGSSLVFFPVFSADGSQLWYQTEGALASVDIDTSNFTISNRRSVLSFVGNPGQPMMDAVPESDRMIISLPQGNVRSGNDQRMELVIVENWIEELKQRLPLE